MATIEDLGKKSFSDLEQDEAIELLRQIRLSRRTSKSKKSYTKKSTSAKKKDTLSTLQAKKLLELLGG